MNSESLGHYSFGQSNPERRSKAAKLDGAKSLASGEGRCVKGVCEVAWKPNQQNGYAQQDKTELMARGD